MSNNGSMFMTADGRPGVNWKHPYIKLMAGVGVGLILLTVILIIAVPRNKASDGGENNPDDSTVHYRPDCLPELTPLNQTDKDKCARRGCTYDDNPPEGQVHCYYPDDYVNYQDVNIQSQAINSTCSPHTWTFTLRKGKRSAEWLDEVAELFATVTVIDESRVRVKVTDKGETRWQVPEPDIDSVVKNIQSFNRECKPLDKALFDLNAAPNGEITIKRKSTGTIIFATDLKKLIFADQFIEVRVQVSNNRTYGLSEHLDRFAKDADSKKKYTIFNTGDPILRDQPLYGSHPFALTYEPGENNTYDGSANGILLFSSNGMEVVFSENKMFTFRLIGGVIDFIVFTGPTGRDVLRQKSELIGHPFMPPFWSLGFHICRYGYENTSHIETVYKRTRDAGIPFDVQWADIDYMNERNMFTLNSTHFKDLPELVNRIHDDGLHFIPILDPAVSGSEPEGTYAPYEEGNAMGIFVKDPKDPSKNWEGKVWNAKTSIFPDFTHPKTSEWWIKHLALYHEVLPFDGLWIDMNEPTTFFPENDGDCPKDLSTSKYDYPPYPLSQRNPIFNQTMCLQAKHYLSNHYNLHNMYAFYEAKMTNEALRRIRNNKRPFIISRATTTGQGVYSGHWNGDIHASWDHLKMSIPTLLDFGLYGMPMVGADICGFFDDYEKNMCMRWQQLGAFYPFTRNHNDINRKDQDPGNPDVPVEVKTATIASLKLRYSLLPYLYTLFYKAHKTGDPVMTPLVLNYPEDVNTHDIDTQFMWGDGLLIAPIVENNTNTVEVYFPHGVWYEYDILEFKIQMSAGGRRANVTFDGDRMGVYVKGGSIIPWQSPKTQTSHQLASPLRLLIALSNEDDATGQVYWDDGDSIEPVKYTLADIKFANGTLTYTPQYNLFPAAIDQIIVLQAEGKKLFNTCKSNQTVCDVTVAGHPLIVDVDLQATQSWSIEFSTVDSPTTVTEAPPTEPTQPTTAPTEPTDRPVPTEPAEPTSAPTEQPTSAPTTQPSEAPTTKPSEAPTTKPSEAPTTKPSEAPTTKPTRKPTTRPTEKPSEPSTTAVSLETTKPETPEELNTPASAPVQPRARPPYPAA